MDFVESLEEELQPLLLHGYDIVLPSCILTSPNFAMKTSSNQTKLQ